MTDLITAHLRHCRAGGLADSTREQRAWLLNKADRELPHGLEVAATDEVEDWLGQDGWAQETLCTYYGHLRAFYLWATRGRTQHLSWDPMADIMAPRRPQGLPHPISEDALAVLLRDAPDRWQIPFRLAAFAGLRSAEVAGILRNQIARDRITVTGKGRKTRSIPTHPEIWSWVENMPPGIVVQMRDGPVCPRHLSQSATVQLARYGAAPATFHWLRHRFGTQLLLPKAMGGAGADIRTVQRLLGHASLATTERYLLVTDEQCRLAVEALPALAVAC